MIRLPGAGPEDVLPEIDGSVLCGLADGRIVRVGQDGSAQVVAETGGRPLGLDRLPDGRLLVCDAERGLLAIDLATPGAPSEVLCDRTEGDRLRLCNNAAVAPDGTIWFTDSSARYGLADVVRDMVENTRSGRLIRLDPSGAAQVVMDGLGFANGVAVLPDSDGGRVLVAATAEAAIHALWTSGPQAGRRDVFAEGLPLMPDNLSLGTDGLVWVGCPSRAEQSLAIVHRLPGPLRRSIGRIAKRLDAAARPFVGLMAFDPSGRMVHRFETVHSSLRNVTGVRERDGTVWLGSLDSPVIACFDLA
ncbi:MAG: SMP-30/gluconolactonase/LRE family protein [Pseudomonadota bacterium]